MRNWILGVITGLVLAFTFLFVAVLILMQVSSSTPRVQDGTTLILELEGEIVEQNPTDLAARLLQRGMKPTLRQIVENIDKAAADRRIAGIVVQPRSPAMGWAKAQEIREALLRFRKSGKKLNCHLQVANLRDYYIATACEKIYMQPVGYLDAKGMRAEAMFLRGTLDKIGAQAEIVHTGPYKTFANTYTEKGLTPEHREMMNWLLDSLYGSVVQAVAEARHKDPAQARAMVEGGPYEPPQAHDAGLIDELIYEDELYNRLKEQDSDKRFRKMTASRYTQVPAEEAGLRGRQKIGIVYGSGTIMRGDAGPDPFDGEQSMGSDSVNRLLRQAGEDGSLKAVIFRVDSPGGDAIASDAIWREVVNLQKKKPVVISMSDVAASGGYYVAATGSPIVASPTTITGSIGVVHGKVNLRGTYDKIGITKDTVTRGANALIDSEYYSYTPEQKKLVEKLAYDMYQQFMQRVADARKKSVEEVNTIAQGRVWTGAQAKEKGLVDELGGLDRAIQVAKQKAGIAADERVQLIPFPRPKTLFEMILERGGSGDVRVPAIRFVELPEGVREMMAARFLNTGAPKFLMPFQLVVK